MDNIGFGLSQLVRDNLGFLVKPARMPQAWLRSRVGQRINAEPLKRILQSHRIGQTKCDMTEILTRCFHQTKRSDLNPAHPTPRHEMSNRKFLTGSFIASQGLASARK
jgi:hypothetical protein